MIGSGWHFTVMPFGFCTAPATFERIMENVLKWLWWKTCLVYLDDIIVAEITFEYHMEKLRKALQRIWSVNLKIFPKKVPYFLELILCYLRSDSFWIPTPVT
uniref:Reverse transcriptase domain-containing protein n=1 Tax=Photinus pyralis TaxID=7054 RepID=A0A1Y1K3W1_PHOPY